MTAHEPVPGYGFFVTSFSRGADGFVLLPRPEAGSIPAAGLYRVKRNEKPMRKERANGEEKPSLAERAMLLEKPRQPERATGREKPSIPERARKDEKPK
jgi:hypothetical protein